MIWPHALDYYLPTLTPLIFSLLRTFGLYLFRCMLFSLFMLLFIHCLFRHSLITQYIVITTTSVWYTSRQVSRDAATPPNFLYFYLPGLRDIFLIVVLDTGSRHFDVYRVTVFLVRLSYVADRNFKHSWVQEGWLLPGMDSCIRQSCWSCQLGRRKENT